MSWCVILWALMSLKDLPQMSHRSALRALADLPLPRDVFDAVEFERDRVIASVDGEFGSIEVGLGLVHT